MTANNSPASSASRQSRNTTDARRQLLVSYAAGQVIFEEGQRGDEMFIIEDGEVEIVRRRGGEERSLVLLEAGDFFGEMSLLEDLPRSATARARTDCRLLPVDASTFDLMLGDHPEVAIRIMRMLSRRLRRFDEAEQRAHAIAAGPLAGVPADLAPRAVAMTGVQAAAQIGADPAVGANPALGVTPLITAAPTVVGCLVHSETGTQFVIRGEGEHAVGRLDPVTGLVPEIDLTALDVQRSLSRRHARIVMRDGRFFLREEIGTANGTFIGTARLATGKESELHDSNGVRFGLVELVFRVVPPVA